MKKWYEEYWIVNWTFTLCGLAIILMPFITNADIIEKIFLCIGGTCWVMAGFPADFLHRNKEILN